MASSRVAQQSANNVLQAQHLIQSRGNSRPAARTNLRTMKFQPHTAFLQLVGDGALVTCKAKIEPICQALERQRYRLRASPPALGPSRVAPGSCPPGHDSCRSNCSRHQDRQVLRVAPKDPACQSSSGVAYGGFLSKRFPWFGGSWTKAASVCHYCTIKGL